LVPMSFGENARNAPEMVKILNIAFKPSLFLSLNS
jgi:hypothetical protein